MCFILYLSISLFVIYLFAIIVVIQSLYKLHLVHVVHKTESNMKITLKIVKKHFLLLIFFFCVLYLLPFILLEHNELSREINNTWDTNFQFTHICMSMYNLYESILCSVYMYRIHKKPMDAGVFYVFYPLVCV